MKGCFWEQSFAKLAVGGVGVKTELSRKWVRGIWGQPLTQGVEEAQRLGHPGSRQAKQ